MGAGTGEAIGSSATMISDLLLGSSLGFVLMLLSCWLGRFRNQPVAGSNPIAGSTSVLLDVTLDGAAVELGTACYLFVAAVALVEEPAVATEQRFGGERARTDGGGQP